MSNKNTTRQIFRRKLLNWKQQLETMRDEIKPFMLDYMEGSEDNERQSLKMMIFTQIIDQCLAALSIILSEI